jgi:SAM-dependent methyltransferase
MSELGWADDLTKQTPYDKEFFDRLRDGVRRSAGLLVPLVVELVNPRSVIDVGCGLGIWLKEIAEHGIDDVLGVDGDYLDRGEFEISPDAFHSADLAQPLRLDRRFDLALSLEVAEHLPESAAATFVESLALLAPVVLFSAAIPRQGGLDHVNEQWPGYWADHFERHGYHCIDCIRPRLWENEQIQFWYAQNALLFVSSETLSTNSVLRLEHARAGGRPMPIVHPRTLELHNPVGMLRRLQRWGIVTEDEIQAKREVLADWERRRATMGYPWCSPERSSFSSPIRRMYRK